MLCVGTGRRSPLPIDQCTLGNWALCFESQSPVTVKTSCLYSTYIKTSSDLCKVGSLVKHISVWGLVGTNCASSPRFGAEMWVSASISTLVLSHLIYVVLFVFFCIKLKSETQNIYNFCMEKKKKECKTPKKWENGNYFLLCWQRSGVRKKRKCYKKYCHFFICS